MDATAVGDEDALIDVESGARVVVNGCQCASSAFDNPSSDEGLHWSDSSSTSVDGIGRCVLAVVDETTEVERRDGHWESISCEKPKKKRSKKPPRPPRPPNRSISFDAADQKFIKELSELAMQKKARIERMKALKNLKNAKSASSSFGSLWAIIATAIFCLIIIWQGASSRHDPNMNFHGSPESSIETNGGIISIQFVKNHSANGSDRASTSNAETVSGLDST